LKFENVEKSTSDQHLLTTELSERYGEIQREIAIIKENLKDKTVAFDKIVEEKNILKMEFDETTKTNETLKTEKEEILAKTKETDLNHEVELAKLTKDIETIKCESKEKVESLESEVNRLIEKIKFENETSENLENYKKKAQLALKKVLFSLFSF
jgi:hypothetical protein